MTAEPTARPDALALQRLYHCEKTAPGQVIVTQPLGAGAVREFTWRQVMDESRCMARPLKSLGYPPGSASRSSRKNTAWRLTCDFAIRMAGRVEEVYGPMYQRWTGAKQRVIRA